MAISRRRFLQFGLMGIIPSAGFLVGWIELPEMPQLLRVTASMLRVRASANADSAEVSRCFKMIYCRAIVKLPFGGGAGWWKHSADLYPRVCPACAVLSGIGRRKHYCDVLAEGTVPYTQAYLINKDGAWLKSTGCTMALSIGLLLYGKVQIASLVSDC
jgi:hypothetical protein